MSYDGMERRADGSKIAVLDERLSNLIDSTTKERARRREYEDKLFDKVVELNDRCLRRDLEGCSILKNKMASNGKQELYRRSKKDKYTMWLLGVAASLALLFIGKSIK